MVWGGISLEGLTDLHVLNRGNLTGARYRDEILKPIVNPYSGAISPGFLLVHNNARTHAAWKGNFRGWGHWHNWLANTFFRPRLNLAPLGQHGSTHSAASKTAQDSPGAQQRPGWWLAGYRSWTIRRLIRSMPWHCRACIQAHGVHTRYHCVLSIWLNEWSQFWDKSVSRSSLCFSTWFWDTLFKWFCSR